MHRTPKDIAIAINKGLDDIGAPIQIRERSVVLSKILDIPKQQAWSLLEGQALPDEEMMKRICEELEIEISLPPKK